MRLRMRKKQAIKSIIQGHVTLYKTPKCQKLKTAHVQKTTNQSLD